MAPQLDAASASQPKLMIVPPRLNLRRTASYNHAQEYRNMPLSATSSRFSLNHLFYSPPPSPSLPSLTKKRPRAPSIKVLVSRPRRTLRTFIYGVVVVTLLYFAATFFNNSRYRRTLFHESEFEMVSGDALPDFPTPIVVGDESGQSQWTVSIPRNYHFPLTMSEYYDMMANCREASVRSRGVDPTLPTAAQADDDMEAPLIDENFVDILDAEKIGMLPSSQQQVLTIEGKGHFVGAKQTIGKPICQSSITYVLESTDAGLGQMMMKLWIYYGLAKATGRGFFLDDTRWGYGAYLDMFQAPPEPSCRPPPRHQMLACPVDAKHLVISNVNAKDMLPDLLQLYKPLKKDKNVEKQIMDLARVGYNALFKLQSDDEEYVNKRIKKLTKEAAGGLTSTQAPVIGMHIRRGDRHPLEYQYRDTYIPSEIYHDKAQHLVDEYYNATMWDIDDTHRSITLLASDDPMIQRQSEFATTIIAQDRIKLAVKEANNQDEDDDLPAIHEFVEESFGWEGGFFSPMFWNLGTERRNNAANAPSAPTSTYGAASVATRRPKPSESTLRLRSFMGRAYLMDLAVLAGASDRIVCAVSATGCRILGVMLGWEEGILEKRWVNIDGEHGWIGLDE